MPERSASDRLRRFLERDCAHELDADLAALTAEDLVELERALAENRLIDTSQRQRAIFALGQRRVSSATDTLVDLLAALDEPGRASAAQALGELRSARALRALEATLADPAPAVRKFALRSLAEYDGERPRELLEAAERSEPDPNLRRVARRALERRRSRGGTGRDG